jgi:cell fate regulator YaaT (PSP1 superfamily)
MRLGLKMKLSDVEYQGDGNKATFYYTADDRVDFRQLIRDLASAFNIRVEMKQVGLRQEAARLGGVGSCGRELCCSTWLTDLRKVNTTAARYQQLSLNPQKLAGQCGKLKCCLNYELDTYLDALRGFPKQDVELKTEKGDASFVKMDIFQNMLWYTYKENRNKWYKLGLDQVKEIIALNRKQEKVASLEDYEVDIIEEPKADFENVVGQDSLTRFDAPKRNKKNKTKSKQQPRSKGDRKQVNPVAQNSPVNPNQQKPGPKRPQQKRTAKPNQNKNQQQNQPQQQGENPNRPPQKKQQRPKKNNGSNPNRPPKTEVAQNKVPQNNTTDNNNPVKKSANSRNRNKKRRPPKKDNNTTQDA